MKEVKEQKANKQTNPPKTPKMVYKQFFSKPDKCSTLSRVFLKEGCLVEGKNKNNHWEAWRDWGKEEGRSCEGTYREKIIQIFHSWIWKPAPKISPSYCIQLVTSYSLGVSESHLPHLLTKATCYYSQHSAAHQAVKVGAAVNDVLCIINNC